jgi:hypothetical protein
VPTVDIKALTGLERVAFRKLLKHRGVVLRVVTCNMADLSLISECHRVSQERITNSHLVNDLKAVEDLV